MQLEEIAGNISLVKGTNGGRFPYSHSVLILDKEVVLIDTGCGINTLRQVKRQCHVDYVINSHTHPDHSAGNWIFRDRPIYVPEEGFNTSGNLHDLSRRFAGEDLANVWQRFVRRQMGFKNCTPTNRYNRKTRFDIGEVILEAIFTPGHTKDHYCFYESSERILFSFDYDLTGFPWYGHEESDVLQFRKSVERLKALSPRTVVSSHRGIVTNNVDEEFDRFCKIIDERDRRLLSLFRNGNTLDQLVELAPIYGKFPYAKPLLRYWESQMIKKHLKQLGLNGKA